MLNACAASIRLKRHSDEINLPFDDELNAFHTLTATARVSRVNLIVFGKCGATLQRSKVAAELNQIIHRTQN